MYVCMYISMCVYMCKEQYNQDEINHMFKAIVLANVQSVPKVRSSNFTHYNF